MPSACLPKFIAPSLQCAETLDRLSAVGPFANHPVHFEEMFAKLFECEAERKEAFGRFAFHVPRQSLAPHRSECLEVVPESELDGVQSRGRPLIAQGGGAATEKVANRSLDVAGQRLQPCSDVLGQLAADDAAQQYDVMAQP